LKPNRPTFRQWRQMILQRLTLKEKFYFYSLVFILFASLLSWGIVSYYSKTQAVPKNGGEYIEGIVGQPRYLNPMISAYNNTDKDLSRIIYSNLFEYNADGKLQNDLAESYEISEDKTTYTVHIRQDVFWHDGEKLTAEDVLFTAKLISDPNYKIPIRSNWSGIETNLIDDYTISFKTTSPFVGFLNTLTFGIMPKHLWESIGPEKFALTDLNLNPIGSGPYKFNSFQKDSNGNIISYKLIANPQYYKQKPYISKVTFIFHTEEDIIDAYNSKEIMGMNSISAQKVSEIKKIQSTNLHKIDVPWYFSVFFNQNKSVPLAYNEVRKALAHATNRQEIVDNVFNGNAQQSFTPFLPSMPGYTDDINKFDFNIDTANKIFEDNDWKKGDDGIRVKNDTRVEFNLVVIDQPDLIRIAEIIKNQWEAVGARININAFSVFDIQQNHIRPREYDALLFGQGLGGHLDPYPFWHSSMRKDPGLNLSIFESSDIDKLIEDGRIEFDEEKRVSIYQEFQKKLAEEVPAVFLYNPSYLYPVNKSIRGNEIQFMTNPSERFSNIENWYLKTKRIWK